ncbi:cytochrome c biogenesis protein CcdA [Flavobacterium sp.]|uniref:protein-disulfide reductase DsbD family protein n=1 Tax=Flavobacterium sp. TaxID=239 RepID=UPI002622CE91|nr:cytochrome c biogenesis protein CcdA [Flavobacterium sp.]
MRSIFFTVLTVLSTVTTFGQIKNPVKWTSKTEQLSETEFNLIVSGTIEDGWHVYSQFTPDGGSLPMLLTFKGAKGNFELIGIAKESPYKKVYSPIFEVNEYLFEHKVVVTQKVKITNPKLQAIKLNLEYQVCKEQCINDSKDFTFALPEISSIAVTETQTPADTTALAVDSAITTTQKSVKNIPAEPKEAKKPVEDKSIWSIFFLSFLGGLAALFTPCVFPMVPMTVSFFTKQSKTPAQGKRNAILYGISIIVIYILLGSIVTAIFGADALNSLSTNVWFNLIFFALLVFFAASFLGAFEIVLPNSWANKVDRQADRGGFIGILFMALALAIVSFSCTGPIVGNLLVISASKGGIAPLIGMFGFSLALALPFMLFALFPSWMNALPKSGGWLNTVKVSLGFLELALAFKFLSNADLVLQKHYFERELFLAVWIIIFGAWAIYLFGKLTLPHDSPVTHLSVGRLFMGLLVAIFTVYLIPGLWGAPLKLISGFPPPMHYSESPNGFSGNVSEDTTTLPEGAHIGPQGIVTFDDYEKGLAYAKSVNKPVFLDFTGDACVNCRKMEENVWPSEEILPLLKNKVVLISLICDRKIDLPQSKQYISKTTGKEIITIGNKWSDFQITRYQNNAQPLYVIQTPDGKDLSKPIGYTPDVNEYKKWLQEGINSFK